MTVPTWPADLPRPNRQGWQAQMQDPRLARQTEAGPPGYRRRWSSTAREVSLVVDLTRSQKASFEAFFDSVQQGAGTFWMPDPTTDGWPMLTADGTPLLTAEGAPMLLSAQWLCLFGASMPVETILGSRARISFSVSVLP